MATVASVGGTCLSGVCEERCKLNRADRSLTREELMIYLEALLSIEIVKITSDLLALKN